MNGNLACFVQLLHMLRCWCWPDVSEADTQQLRNLAMPDPATAEGQHIFMLWRWAWVAALATGAVVWGLIFYACWRFRRRSDDEIPVQTRYNLPLEIFYTIAPIIMVVVFFVHTERTQNDVRERRPAPRPDRLRRRASSGRGPSTTCRAGRRSTTPDDKVALQRAARPAPPPTLVLPVDKTVEFKLHSPDVIHDFGVPGFLRRWTSSRAGRTTTTSR